MTARHRNLVAALAVGVMACVCGCQPTASQSQGRAAATASERGAATWEAYYLQGAKIGYGSTVVSKVDRGGESLALTESNNHLKLQRYGQTVEQQIKLSTLETPAGQLLEFHTEVSFGPSPVVFSGHVEGDTMLVQTSTQGKTQMSNIAWASDIRGFRGAEQTLANKPLVPGEKRSLRMLVPLVNQVAEVELAAADYEVTRLLEGDARLLRVETSARLPDGNVMGETLWCDKQGVVQKRRIAGIEQESFRTTAAVAQADAPAGETPLDVGIATTVPINPPLAQAHQAHEIRYRVELPSGDPLTTFATGATQSLCAISPHVAELTVRSMRPGQAATAGGNSESAPAAAEYLQANSVLQVDDARIKAMAAEARGDKSDPVQVALALERYVHDAISSSDLTQAFATAAEVAESRSGDCTEHAVLLAALSRACGIPSRVAIGLVYVERSAGFGYHMWTEVYLDGQWWPLDATIGQGGIGPAHIKLVDSSLEGASAYSAFLPVAKVVGQLEISVIEAK